VTVITRSTAHEEVSRPIDHGRDSAIGGTLVRAIQRVDDLVELLIGHGSIERESGELRMPSRSPSPESYAASESSKMRARKSSMTRSSASAFVK